MTRLRYRVGLCLVVLASVAACRTERTGPEAPPPAPTPTVDHGPPPDVVAIMICFRGIGRRLADGTSTRGMTEALVVRRDGSVDLRDGDEKGLLIARAVIASGRVARLAATVTSPAWASLVGERGAPTPDGPSCEIVANHRRVKRFANPDDEPVVKEAWSDLKAIWAEVDR